MWPSGFHLFFDSFINVIIAYNVSIIMLLFLKVQFYWDRVSVWRFIVISVFNPRLRSLRPQKFLKSPYSEWMKSGRACVFDFTCDVQRNRTFFPEGTACFSEWKVHVKENRTVLWFLIIWKVRFVSFIILIVSLKSNWEGNLLKN